jgi:hypothetical protein
MSKSGPDWTPPAFTAITAPVLKEADFSSIAFLGGGSQNQNQNQQQQAGTPAVAPQVSIQITNTPGISSEVTQQQSEGLAASISLKSGG